MEVVFRDAVIELGGSIYDLLHERRGNEATPGLTAVEGGPLHKQAVSSGGNLSKKGCERRNLFFS